MDHLVSQEICFSFQHNVENLMVLRTPEDYLRRIPGYLSARIMSEGTCKPKHSVKLCVSSNQEEVKCTWMSKAAASLTVQPSLECVHKMNLTSCLKSVSERETDVVVVPPDYLYDAVTYVTLHHKSLPKAQNRVTVRCELN